MSLENVRFGADFKDAIFIGPVVANNDPMQAQRVQVRIPILHDNVPDAQLPWCMRADNDGVGQGGGASTCKVPVVNSYVCVKFQEGDMHQPMYVAMPSLPGTLDALFKTNYPNRYGFVDPTGNQFYIDMLAGDMKFKHSSGATISIDKNGNGSAVLPGTLTATATGAGTLTAASWKVNGTVEFTNNVQMDQQLTVTGAAQFNGGVTSA